MSTLWTPSGEHEPRRDADPADPSSPGSPSDSASGGSPPGDPGPEAQAEVEAMRAQLAHTPPEVVVANHCYGLFELAAIYLSQTPPMLFQARLAIDGLGYLLTGLKGRLGEAEPSLLDALAQLQLGFVQLEGVERAAAESAANSAEG